MPSPPNPRDLPSVFRATGASADAFWRGVVDGLEEAVLIVGADRRVLYGNRAAQSLMSAPIAEARGQLCVDAIACPQCECMCRLFEEGGVSGIEVEIYVPGVKEPRTFRKNAQLLRSSDGAVVGGIETLTDITVEVADRGEKQRRAELLFQEKRRSEALLRSVCEGIVSLDGDGTIREISDQVTTLSGHRPTDLVGQHLRTLVNIDATVDPTSPPPQPVDCELVCRDGSTQPVRATFLPMRFGADEVLCVLGNRDAAAAHDDVARIEKSFGFHGMISRSPRMRDLFRLVESAADSDANVIVEGESGTGKELIARALHQASARRREPFYAVNCATFTGSLLLSELFGHERGAFTGAIRMQRGKLEMAGQGTLLLDEVAEIPLRHQSLLLRVLETRQFERLGGQQSLEIGARIIAATNRRLRDAVDDGAFREDLYYRLNVLPIRVPPLRERPEDIELLAHYFLGHTCGEDNTDQRVSGAAVDLLVQHHWPGNVRELSNVMDYAAFSARGRTIEPHHLPEDIRAPSPASPTPSPLAPTVPASGDAERTRILDALEATHYRRADAARRLGIDRSTLWRRMKRLGIRVD